MDLALACSYTMEPLIFLEGWGEGAGEKNWASYGKLEEWMSTGLCGKDLEVKELGIVLFQSRVVQLVFRWYTWVPVSYNVINFYHILLDQAGYI
jgi:hypothetical protein